MIITRAILYDKLSNMFFDKTCSIYTTTYTTVWGVANKTYTLLYEDIPCNYEQNKAGFYAKGFADNVDIPKYIIVIPLTYKLVRENYKIVLTDPFLWELWSYVISSVNANKSISGWIDCITLYAETLKWA